MAQQNQSESVTITADDVAAILNGDCDEVSQSVLAAVLAAVVERGDTPDADLVRALPVTVRAWDDGNSEETECDWSDDADDYEAAAEELWDGADYGDGDYCVTVSWQATDAAGNEVASGSFDLTGETAEPECSEDEHDWTSEGEGGCTENPGVWSVGGTAMVFKSHCRCCGLHRTQHVTGSQRNPGECDTTEYTPADSWCAECQSEECECDAN